METLKGELSGDEGVTEMVGWGLTYLTSNHPVTDNTDLAPSGSSVS